MSIPQETCVSTRGTYRQIKKEPTSKREIYPKKEACSFPYFREGPWHGAPVSAVDKEEQGDPPKVLGVAALTNRLHTLSADEEGKKDDHLKIPALVNRFHTCMESSKVKEKVDGTTLSAEEEGKKDDHPKVQGVAALTNRLNTLSTEEEGRKDDPQKVQGDIYPKKEGKPCNFPYFHGMHAPINADEEEEKDDPPEVQGVAALMSRFHAGREISKAKERVDGTTLSADEEGRSDDPPFPWLSKINDLCRSTVGSKNIKALENLLTVYLQKVTSSVKDCYQKPKRATKLKMCMNRTFVYFHFLYQDIKESVDSTIYLEKMTELMAMYLDLEIASSRRRRETTKKVVSRMASALDFYLDRSEDHILDALMRAKSIKFSEREVCCPILKKVLMSFQKRQMQDTLYVRYLLVFKLWKKIVGDMAERKKINVLAIDKLPAPANFADRYKRFNNVLPRVPTNKNITTFYMQAKIDVTKACQNFMKISKDPAVPVMPDKPLFFEGRSLSTFSGKGNSFDGGVSRNLMNEIWSSYSEDNTSNKKSNSNKKKGKNKKAEKKKEKSDSISETESTPEVPTVKTQTWEAPVDVRADVVMINASQPPPPGTEPPRPSRIPPPPPPLPLQSKPLPPPALPRAPTPAPAIKIVAKPIATIVAMKKEVVPEDDLPAYMKTISLVPKIDIKAEPDVEMTPSRVEPEKPHFEESAKPRFEQPMEMVKPAGHFEPDSEMEQVFQECEVQLGDQDLPYIEEEVVEPCNPVWYAESPEAEFEKAAGADVFGASQAKGLVEAESQEMGRKRPEKTMSPAVGVQGVKLVADIQIVPLQHIKSERIDSPELEPVPCFRARKVEKVKPERTSSKPNGLVLASRPKEAKSSRQTGRKEEAAVIQAEKLVVSRESHSGLHTSDSVPRKSWTLSNEAPVSPSKSHFSVSESPTLSNKVQTSSSEGCEVLHKVRTSSSERLTSSSKVRSSSSESHSSSSKVRSSSSEAHISSPKIQTLSSESHTQTPKARMLSSAGHEIRTSSSEGHTSSPKIRTSTSVGHNSSSKIRPSSESLPPSPKSKVPLRESHTSSPKRQNSTSEVRVSPKIPTSSSEGHKIRNSLCDTNCPSPKIQSSTSEGNTSLPKIPSSVRNTSSPKIRTSSSEGHKSRTSSGERQTPSPKNRASLNGVLTSPNYEKLRPLTSNSQLHSDKMPTLQAELPSPTKSERPAKPERPQPANGLKQHQDNGMYRNSSYVAEYGQATLPQNDLADLEIALIPMTDHVWSENVEKRVEKAAALKQEMPPPKLQSPRADKSRSPRSSSPRASSPRTPSPRAEFCVGVQRTEQPPPPRVELSPAPFSAFAAPNPPSPQKSAPFGFVGLPVGIADIQFAVPRAPEPDPKPRYSLELGNQPDLYLEQPFPSLDLNNSVDGIDFDADTFHFCDDSLFGGYPFNEDYMFNMPELSHTCMVDPNVLEQRHTTTMTSVEQYPSSTYATDPIELQTARETHNYLTSLPNRQTTVPDVMPNFALMAGSFEDDDSSGYASYAGSTSSVYLDHFGNSEYPGAMPDPSASVASDGASKTSDVQKPQDDAKAATSKVESRKRLHAATRSHPQENPAVLNCSPLGGSKPTVPRAGTFAPPYPGPYPNPRPATPGKACCRACLHHQFLAMRYNAARYRLAYHGKPVVRERPVVEKIVAPVERVKTDTEENEEIRQMVREYERRKASESRAADAVDSESNDSVELEVRNKTEHSSLPPKKRHKAMSMERPAISHSFPSYPTRPMMSIADLEEEKLKMVAKDDRLENAKKREEIIARYKKPEKVDFDKLKPLPPIIRSVNVRDGGRPGQPSRSYPAPTRATSGSVNFAEQSAGRSFKTPAQLKEHTFSNRDNVYYRCGPYIGEYGQIIYPQNPNESMSQKESMILKRLSYVEQPKPILDLSVAMDCPSKQQKEAAPRKKSKEKSNANTRASKRKSQSKKPSSEADGKRRR